ANTTFSESVDAGALLRESAKPAGINIEVNLPPNDGYWSDVWMKKPWCACYWSGRPTENWMFSQVYAADASWNDTFWKHEKFNKLLVQGRAELNSEKRREIYVDMQKIVNTDGGLILPLFLSDVMAINDKIGLPDQIGNNWELDGMKNTERWWFV
ncbi:MAG: peptide ABC transporter substrate-binding protein, partial [Gammaproteobacteria bacterium]|nr:peptide ABC transporter substrate-binding protein [Gammaproteobacteria bacterium]